jgi:alkaline phosphatase D
MAAAIGATAAWCNAFGAKSGIAWTERRDLFPEGVASGDPDSNSVLLWTRRPPSNEKDPDKSGAGRIAPLNVEVAEDERFSRVVAATTAPVSAESDWTCRVLVGGLKPGRVYWYRFTDSEGFGSRVGRTKEILSFRYDSVHDLHGIPPEEPLSGHIFENRNAETAVLASRAGLIPRARLNLPL